MTNYLVSGCPRSGTSLVMRILQYAGMPIATDNMRKADRNNKYGYFEIDNIINKIKKRPDVVFQYCNKALKIIHYGLQFLPQGNYKIIYVERDVEEVMQSIERMRQEPIRDREKARNIFLMFNAKIKRLLAKRSDFAYILINHGDLLRDPSPVLDKIATFYGLDSSQKGYMVAAIDFSLYRNRNTRLGLHI